VQRDPAGLARHRRGEPAPALAAFSEQQRDIYIPPGGQGFWQAAFREETDERRAALGEAIASGGRITADLLYADHEGGQPTITRFVLLPEGADGWRPEVARHWSVPEP
jgi:hypothetical protein